eukprot:2448391-Pyramimonas_sp.AAC.1
MHFKGARGGPGTGPKYSFGRAWRRCGQRRRDCQAGAAQIAPTRPFSLRWPARGVLAQRAQGGSRAAM